MEDDFQKEVANLTLDSGFSCDLFGFITKLIMNAWLVHVVQVH